MRDKEDARARLTRFAEQLRKLSFPTSQPISIDLAEYVADAIKRYIDGNEKSLDTAFGLEARPRKPKGRPKKSERNLAIAIDFIRLCLEREPRVEGKKFYEEGDDIKDWRRRMKNAKRNSTFQKTEIAVELAERYRLSGANKILEIVKDYRIEALRSLIESGDLSILVLKYPPKTALFFGYRHKGPILFNKRHGHFIRGLPWRIPCSGYPPL